MRATEIEGYNGKYYVTDDGQVYYVHHSRGPQSHYLVQRPSPTSAYLYVGLYHDGIWNHVPVHRLVASVYCSQAPDCNVVNHIDGNILNNHYTNLEWTTQKDNLLKTSVGFRRHIKHYSLYVDGEFIIDFNCLIDAAKYTSRIYGVSESGIAKYKKSKRNNHVYELKV